LDASKIHHVAVIGAGNLGRALMTFLESRRATLKIVAAFDDDPAKTNRVYNGVPCYLMDQVEEVVKREGVRIAILCVPGPVAQRVADRLVKIGVKGILNFAPVPIRIPVGVALEEIDLTSALERVAFFTNNRANAPKERRYADR
jgi:redox-sensing transcriptional repressor